MLSGDPADVFDQSVRIIAELFAVKVVCLSEIIGRDLRFKSVYVNGVVLRDAGTCPLAGMPCATVEMTKDFRAFDRGTERFPEASFLKDRQAVACCRFPALDHTGKVMALTCLLDDKPHEFTEEDQDILRLFGQRIAAEIERARHAAERKRIEDKLRESEARLGFLLSATPAVIYSARATGDYGATFASDNLTKALGYSPEEFVGDPRFWADRIHPDDRERVFAELRRLFEGGTYEHEYRFLHKDGTYRWMRDALEVIRDADGQPVELIGCWIDITDHKVAEEALAKAELYYRTIFQEAGVGVAQIDSQTGQFLKVNRKYCEIVGLTEDEMVAETFMSITHPDDLAEDIGFMERLRRGELSSFAMEKRYIKKKDGSIVWVILNVAPLWQTGEIPSQHIAVIQDITARKQIEQELRTAKERFDLAVEGSKTGIWDWDLRTNHVHYSSLWKRQIGYQDHELEGRFEEWESRLHPEDLDQVLDTVQTYLRDQRSHYEAGRPYENEFRLRHKDGSYRWILARGVAIQDEEGQLYRMSGSHVDITEHKLAGEEWRKALALLRSVINATPDFIIAKDRELRTILCNNACAQAVGKSPNEMIGRTDIENGWDPELVCGNPEKGIRGFEADDRDALSGVVVHNLNDPAIVGGEVRRFDNYKAPLLGDGGEVIGMLGVARDVTDRIRMESDLKRNEARLQEAQRLAKLGNWELDLRSNTIVWSDEICRIFEIDAMQFGAFYESFLSAVHPDDRAMVNDAYTNSVAERKPYSLAHRLLMPDGRIKYVHERGETDYDQSGHPIRSHGTVQDVTERRLAELQIETALREKETLLREVHHRVKNNLQIISSLLYFQSKKIRDAEDLSAFRDGQDRLKSMILVHEKLYRSDNLTRIEFGDYVRALIDGIRQSHGPMSTKIDTVVDVPQISLPVEIAMPVGMIVNELLTNTFKYAFPGERKGVVRICATSAEEAFEVLFEDTGAGFPEGVDPDRPETFGLQLIHSLTAQLGGRLSFGREGGASVRVHVPIPVPA